jgi:hypothetical protein
MKERDWMVGIPLVVALAPGLDTGYLLWCWPTNWYARDVTSLPASPENDVIRYGHSLIVETSKHIGKAVSDPQPVNAQTRVEQERRKRGLHAPDP